MELLHDLRDEEGQFDRSQLQQSPDLLEERNNSGR